MPEASVRDQIIAQLATLMTVHQIARLQFHEVADVDPKTKYVEGRSSVGTLVLPDEIVQNLENYLNAQPPGRPFLDFRPDIGSYLFPSPKTGMALSTWAMHPDNRQKVHCLHPTHHTGTTTEGQATPHIQTMY